MFTLKIYSSKGISIHSICGSGVTIVDTSHSQYQDCYQKRFGDLPEKDEKKYCFVHCYPENTTEMVVFAISENEEGYVVNQNGKTVQKLIAN